MRFYIPYSFINANQGLKILIDRSVILPGNEYFNKHWAVR